MIPAKVLHLYLKLIFKTIYHLTTNMEQIKYFLNIQNWSKCAFFVLVTFDILFQCRLGIFLHYWLTGANIWKMFFANKNFSFLQQQFHSLLSTGLFLIWFRFCFSLIDCFSVSTMLSLSIRVRLGYILFKNLRKYINKIYYQSKCSNKNLLN